MKFLSLLLVLSLASTCAFSQHDDWFVFQPQQVVPGNAIDQSHWLTTPAGKHGFLTYEGNDFVFRDGTAVKFWGVNICSNKPFVDATVSKQWTAFMRYYGINGVRFHKFTWDATDGIHSTQLTESNWKNFDFFCDELRRAGIYYSWSAIYGHRVLAGDSSRMIAYDEVKNTKFPWSHLNGTTSSLVNFAEDLQAINIELYVNMLNHRNPFTGLRYAEDSALTFIELQNEDNIFWGAIENTLNQTPTYKALLSGKFSRWLKEKYHSQEALRKAWGADVLAPEETMDAENIYPHPDHGIFSYEYEQALIENRRVPVYIADRASFLYEEQVKFYERFVKAIRDTGYKGVIVGSCWQAGSGITHFYNLHADYLVGPIDRHNYFGGGGGHTFKAGPFKPDAMVSSPGSGLLSTGFQMVADRPFQISEWMSLIPTEWTAESAPLIAAYGMGLQGWDASYSFAMDYPHFTPTIQSGHGIYNVTSPTHLALYPALATMIYRNDIEEAEVIANRNVSLPDLGNGKLDFIEKTSQQYDIKSFASAVPPEVLAIGAVSVSFDKGAGDPRHQYKSFWDKEKKMLHATTGQLKWDYSGKGFVTINTEGTKALIGFAKGKTHALAPVSMTCENDFAVIFITAIGKGSTIADGERLLITTVARAANTGMRINEKGDELLTVGEAPIVLEPVTATLTIERKDKPTVYVLDHSGNRTGETVPVKDGKILLDARKYRTLYYEIVY